MIEIRVEGKIEAADFENVALVVAARQAGRTS